jgi:hypothetical protein
MLRGEVAFVEKYMFLTIYFLKLGYFLEVLKKKYKFLKPT